MRYDKGRGGGVGFDKGRKEGWGLIIVDEVKLYCSLVFIRKNFRYLTKKKVFSFTRICAVWSEFQK